MDVFEDTGFSPWRTMPRTMCFRSASGCSADRPTSRSRMARTRGQSVLEACEEDLFFISSRFPKGDHVNSRERLGMNDGNGDSTQQTQRHQTLPGCLLAYCLDRGVRPLCL